MVVLWASRRLHVGVSEGVILKLMKSPFSNHARSLAHSLFRSVRLAFSVSLCAAMADSSRMLLVRLAWRSKEWLIKLLSETHRMKTNVTFREGWFSFRHHQIICFVKQTSGEGRTVLFWQLNSASSPFKSRRPQIPLVRLTQLPIASTCALLPWVFRKSALPLACAGVSLSVTARAVATHSPNIFIYIFIFILVVVTISFVIREYILPGDLCFEFLPVL